MMKRIIQNNWIFLLALGLLLFYLSPYFFLDYVKLLIHDNLDSNVTWFKLISGQENFWSFENYEVKGFLGGVPSGFFRNEFSYITVVYRLFSVETAYSINAILIHLSAFFSAFILLRDYILKNRSHVLILALSLSFAIIPFRTAALMTIAAQPLVIWAFLNLWNRKKSWLSYIALAIFPFFSDLFFSNIFFYFILTLAIGFLCVYQKRFSIEVLLGLLMISLSTFVLNFKIIDLIVFEGFESHRQLTRLESEAPLNFFGLIGMSLKLAFKGQYHAIGFPNYLIHLVVLGVALYKVNIEKIKILGLSLFTLVLFGTLSQLQYYKGFDEISRMIPILGTLQLRFQTLIPLVQFLTLSVLIGKTSFSKPYDVLVQSSIFSLIIFQFLNISQSDFKGSKYSENTFWSTYIEEENKKYSTLKSYSKQSSIEQISSYLAGKNVSNPHFFCVGLNPSVLQMNSLPTMGGYFSLVPAKYFLKWGEFIDPELRKSKELEKYFKNWGNSCYTFSSEVFDQSEKPHQIEYLDLNFSAFESIQDKYIVSDLPILMLNNINIDPVLITKALNQEDDWLYLYELK
jgi:hypothetical protein